MRSDDDTSVIPTLDWNCGVGACTGGRRFVASQDAVDTGRRQPEYLDLVGLIDMRPPAATKKRYAYPSYAGCLNFLEAPGAP